LATDSQHLYAVDCKVFLKDFNVTVIVLLVLAERVFLSLLVFFILVFLEFHVERVYE